MIDCLDLEVLWRVDVVDCDNGGHAARPVEIEEDSHSLREY